MRHFQNREYERAQQARTRCPYRGPVSKEPSRRGWQGNVKQCSTARFKTRREAEERRKYPTACQVRKTGALKLAATEQHECSDVTRFPNQQIEIPWKAAWSKWYCDQEPGCHPRGENSDEKVQQ